MMLFDDLDLFDEGKKRFTQFELLDAELQLWEQFFTRDESDDYFRVLRDATPWQQRMLNYYPRQWDIPLTHGSFLLMGETMQDLYEHHIPKTAKPIGPRINLTFRISDSTKPVYYVNVT